MISSSNFDIPIFEQWLKDNTNLREGSIYMYVGSVQRFLSSSPNLENLDDYNNFLVKYTIKKRAYHYFAAIRHFIDFKIADGGLKDKILHGLLRPKIWHDYVQERKYFQPEKLMEILNYMQTPKHMIVCLIQILTGLRVGDILRLKRGRIESDVYEGANVLKLTVEGKGGKRNVVHIHDEISQKFIWDYILNNVNYSDYYFIELGAMRNRTGDKNNEFKLIKMNYWWYWADLKQSLQTAGVDRKVFASHDFRRCFARRVWTKYKDIYILQKMLNHSDPKITLKYLEQSGLHTIDYQKEMQKLV